MAIMAAASEAMDCSMRAWFALPIALPSADAAAFAACAHSRRSAQRQACPRRNIICLSWPCISRCIQASLLTQCSGAGLCMRTALCPQSNVYWRGTCEQRRDASAALEVASTALPPASAACAAPSACVAASSAALTACVARAHACQQLCPHKSTPSLLLYGDSADAMPTTVAAVPSWPANSAYIDSVREG